jgi:hypothetical protein
MEPKIRRLFVFPILTSRISRSSASTAGPGMPSAPRMSATAPGNRVVMLAAGAAWMTIGSSVRWLTSRTSCSPG